MGKTLDWILKQSSDELAAESSQGKGGITNWLLKQSMDELADWSSRDTDLKEVKSPFMPYRFNHYEEVITYLDNIKKRYNKEKTDREMNDALDNAYRYAKSYFHK
jgi:hypothetical protein